MKLFVLSLAVIIGGVGLGGAFMAFTQGLSMATGLGDFSPYQFFGGLIILVVCMDILWKLRLMIND